LGVRKVARARKPDLSLGLWGSGVNLVAEGAGARGKTERVENLRFY